MKFEHEVIPSNGTLPFNAFTFRAQDLSRVIPQHWHQSTELIYCLDGQLDVWLEGTHFRLRPSDLLVINPNTVHATQSLMVNHVLCIQLPLTYLKQLTENQFNRTFLFNLNTVGQQTEDSLALQAPLRQLASLLETPRPAATLAINIQEQAVMLTILAELIAHHSTHRSQRVNKSTAVVELMTQVTRYLDDHFYERLSLHQVAQAFNYSDSYFSRAFKNHFNMNFHDFLISVRLNDAVNKLITSDLPIAEIARNSGFETYRNLYNAFLRVYQVTPKAYRDNLMN